MLRRGRELYVGTGQLRSQIGHLVHRWTKELLNMNQVVSGSLFGILSSSLHLTGLVFSCVGARCGLRGDVDRMSGKV